VSGGGIIAIEGMRTPWLPLAVACGQLLRRDDAVPAWFPRLARLVWNRDLWQPIRGEEVLAVYEANSRHVEANALTNAERASIETLADRFGADRFGNGHLLVGRSLRSGFSQTGALGDHRGVAGKGSWLLMTCRCWFGGGARIVLELGECRSTTRRAVIMGMRMPCRNRGSPTSSWP
jgi:hypothetical protein